MYGATGTSPAQLERCPGGGPVSIRGEQIAGLAARYRQRRREVQSQPLSAQMAFHSAKACASISGWIERSTSWVPGLPSREKG